MTDQTEMKMTTAEPAAFGLMGLAVVTLVAWAVKLGWIDGSQNSFFIVPWAFMLGAIPQLITSFMEFRRNNTFGATAFGAYGMFWLGLGLTYMWGFENNLPAADYLKHLGFAFVGFLVFNTYMMIGSMTLNKGLFAVFAFIELLFFGLIMSIFFPGTWSEWGHFAGWAELGVSISAFYVSAAVVLNQTTCYTILPLGKPLIHPRQLCIAPDEQTPSAK
jgi:succinate-acetate transporter protein